MLTPWTNHSERLLGSDSQEDEVGNWRIIIPILSDKLQLKTKN